MGSIVYVLAKRQVADDHPPDDLTGKSLVAFFTSLKKGGILPFVFYHHKTVVHIFDQRAYPRLLFSTILCICHGNKPGKTGKTNYMS